MAQAYDFALDKIGLDIHAFPIWNDYVTFLKAVDAVGSYAENQKISAVRKVRIFNVFSTFLWRQVVTVPYGILHRDPTSAINTVHPGTMATSHRNTTLAVFFCEAEAYPSYSNNNQ